VSQRKGNYSGEAYESFVHLGESFGETPQCRGYGAECFEAGEKLCAKGINMRIKGVRSKVTLRNLRAGLNVREVPVGMSWG